MEKLHIPWSDIMGMWYYQFESCLDAYAKILEERKKAEDDEKGNLPDMQKAYSPNNIMKQAKGMMPKIPNFSIPKF